MESRELLEQLYDLKDPDEAIDLLLDSFTSLMGLPTPDLPWGNELSKLVGIPTGVDQEAFRLLDDTIAEFDIARTSLSVVICLLIEAYKARKYLQNYLSFYDRVEKYLRETEVPARASRLLSGLEP